MPKKFNVNGACNPNKHYMVNLDSRLEDIRAMIDDEEYFTINKARQYGKTTTLKSLVRYLKDDYEVVSLDFQALDASCFENASTFVAAFSKELLIAVNHFPAGIKEELIKFSDKTQWPYSLQDLFIVLLQWCQKSEKDIVLLIDEVDTATNNQIFLDFLAQLRLYYLRRPEVTTFKSVILAGVHDVRSIKRKIRPDEDEKSNSPWNVAADFEIDMNFSVADIEGMLTEYEADYKTGMDIHEISQLIYDYTSGYPVLVSRICKLLDEKISRSREFPCKSSAWTKDGFYEAEKRLVKEDNPLFESLVDKLETYPELKKVISDLLFNGVSIPYIATSPHIKDAAMFGFIKNDNDRAVISNRIFEAVLYNNFIAESYVSNETQEQNDWRQRDCRW